MKKNFLLMFLMALLPLAGWADNYDIGGEDFTFEIQSVTFPYTGGAVNVGARLTKNDVIAPIAAENYTLYYYVAGQSTGTTTAPTAVGNYEVQAQGIPAKGYEGTTQKIAFSITKGTITAGDFTAPIAVATDLTYSGEAQTLVTAGTVNAQYGTLKYKLSTESEWSTTLPKGTDAGTYTINWKIEGSANYNDYTEGEDLSKSIVKKAAPYIAVSGVPTANATYNGNEQKISGITVTVKTAEEGDVLATYNNPVVKYYTDGERTTESTAVTDAKTYYLKITEPTTGTVNYSFTSADKTYTINPMTLTLSVGAKTKVYDGTPLDVAEGQVNHSALAAGDANATLNGFSVIPNGDGDNFSGAGSVVVGSYPVKVKTAGATITKTVNEAPVDVTNNYTLITPAKNWTITTKTLSIAVDSKTIASGVKPSTLTDHEGENDELSYTLTGAVVIEEGDYAKNDENTINGILNIAFNNEVITNEQQESTTLNAQTFENAIVVTNSNAEAEIWNNYTLDLTNAKANLTISGKAFTIAPSITNVQYGTTVEKDYTAYDNTTFAAATVDETKLKYQFKLQSATEWTTWTDENKPTKVGTYDVRFLEEGVKYGSGNYEGGDETRQPSVFTIMPKQLTITVLDKTVFVGDNAELFLDNLKELGAGTGKAYTVTGLVPGETIDVEFSLDPTVVDVDEDEGTIDGYQEGKSKEDASILIALTATGVYNGNYEIPNTYTKGKLDISNDLSVDLAAETAATTIATADENGGLYDVTISGRKLNANKWNVMVLPFAVKPLDFCNAIGQYAVFNTLKSVEKDAEDQLKDKIYFKLEMNEIPANTPFLVKPLEAVDFDTTWDDDDDDETPEVKLIVFEDVTFKNAGMQPVYDKVAGATFTGNYAASYAIPSTNFWAMQGGQFNHFSDTLPLGFTRAYIELTSGAESARFFIEEPNGNGSTTAIKELNINTMESVDAEGMYNLNGMKLNGAPTQKGVYIKNGKKYLVK